MIEAVIFDMDGLLVDSEPLWKKAEQIAFKTVGIDLDDELCAQTTGLDSNDVIQHWYKLKPWEGTSFGTIKDIIEENVINLVSSKHGKLQEGVDYIIDFVKKKNVKMALASSSPMKIIKTFMETFNLHSYFQVIHSSEVEESGKPHPAVYIATMKRLGVSPLKTIAFEDSFYGLLAAKSAKLKAVAVLHPDDYSKSKFEFADIKLKSLLNFTEQHWEYLNSMN